MATNRQIIDAITDRLNKGGGPDGLTFVPMSQPAVDVLAAEPGELIGTISAKRQTDGLVDLVFTKQFGTARLADVRELAEAAKATTQQLDGVANHEHDPRLRAALIKVMGPQFLEIDAGSNGAGF